MMAPISWEQAGVNFERKVNHEGKGEAIHRNRHLEAPFTGTPAEEAILAPAAADAGSLVETVPARQMCFEGIRLNLLLPHVPRAHFSYGLRHFEGIRP